MRRGLVIAVSAAAAIAADAMPLGLRTAMWGIAPANRRTDQEAAFPALSEEATAGDVAAALNGAADDGLAANIADADGYGAFREWAKRIGMAAVKASDTAWLSFALGTDRLIAKELTDGDVRIVSFSVYGQGSGSPRMAFDVAIDGVMIGSGPVAEAILKENLRKVIAVEGTVRLFPGAFSSDAIGITFDTPRDGKARLTATPPPNVNGTYFIRVKIK